MHLAIFLDAETVTGPVAWLDACRDALYAGLRDDNTWFSRMALPVAQLRNRRAEGGFWRQMLNREGSAFLDVKKAGIFPVVHGVRVMALEAGIRASNTFDRIEALASEGMLEKMLADDLVESLTFLMRLRLEAGLELFCANKTVTNEVDTASLSTLDKDLLKDALLVIKRFKHMINRRYHLDRF